MKTLNKLIATAVLMFVFLPAFAQNDSIKSYSGFEFDLTACKMKKKLIASSNKIINYCDTVEYSGISSILLIKDTAGFIDNDKEIKLNISEVSELSFKTGSYSVLGVLIGIPAGMIIGSLIGKGVAPPTRSFDLGGAPLGALIGMICGGIIGGIAAPSSYDNYYLKGKNNDDRRLEMKSILDSAKVKYINEL